MLSVNALPYVRTPSKKIKQSSVTTVTIEESKLIRTIREQFDRRGGFVRIFPAADTWIRYSKYLGA